MERWTIALILLFVVLMISTIVLNESFVDASGNDASGNIISLSLKDLLTIMGSVGTTSSAPSTTTIIQPQPVKEESSEPSLDDQFYKSIRGDLLKDVRATVREQLQKQAAGSQTVLTDSCIDSIAEQQGTDWMRYIPGKNPADYIRKDSIPCYSCSIPT